jgi:hypothetical protein
MIVHLGILVDGFPSAALIAWARSLFVLVLRCYAPGVPLPPAQAPLFIVGTGRCGSTMLSELLSLHPAILSLSELFNSVYPLGFQHDPLDGTRLWYILREPRVRHTVWLQLMERGLTIDEFRYPLAAAGRFRETGIPPLLAMTLPPLCDDPDALHEALREFVQALPQDRLYRQYLAIFEWLCARLGRRYWCERSGGSLFYLDFLISSFPEARFVHVYRDGRESALSARRFHPMRLAKIGQLIHQKTGVNPYMVRVEQAPKNLPAEWHGLLPHCFDLEAYQRLELPIELFCGAWSSTIEKGVEQLSKLPPARVLHVRYESILAAPRPELQRLIRFMDPCLDDPAWLELAAARVRPNPSRWASLPARERATLEAACSAGMERLRGLERPDE